jgi:O-antigen ligase
VTTFLVALILIAKVSGIDLGGVEFEGGYIDIHNGGFGAGSTGWSNGLAFPSAFALALVIDPRRPKAEKIVPLVCYFLISAEQAWVSGRAGLIAPIAAAYFYEGVIKLSTHMGWKLLFGGLGLIGILAWNLFYDELAIFFRVERNWGNYSGYWDKVSSGRVSTYLRAIELIEQRPWTGYGFDDFRTTGLWGQYFVHNVWLKYLYQAGIFYAMTLFTYKMYTLHIVNRLQSISYSQTAPYGLIILAGLVISMLEPNIILGSFQIAAMWWFVAIACFSTDANE